MSVPLCPVCHCGVALHDENGCQFQGQNTGAFELSEYHVRTDDGSDPDFEWVECRCPMNVAVLGAIGVSLE